MTEPIDLTSYLEAKYRLMPEEISFDALVHQLRDLPLPALIEALTAARDITEITELAAYLLDLAAP
jgi:hypothetical protein